MKFSLPKHGLQSSHLSIDQPTNIKDMNETELDFTVKDVAENYTYACIDFPWLHRDATQRIEEFTDICRKEKLFFESWNHYIIGVNTLRGAQVDLPGVCTMFARAFIENEKKKITQQFLLHLLHSVKCGLLTGAVAGDTIFLIANLIDSIY